MKKGFTLVELIILLAIFTVLVFAVFLMIDPAERLAEARDIQRLNNLNALNDALNIFIKQSSLPDLGMCAEGGRCAGNPADGNGPFRKQTCAEKSTNQSMNGLGYADVNFNSIPGGSPMAMLPLDPQTGPIYFYAYMCSDTDKIFELDGRLESKKYREKMKNDGGDRNDCITYTENTCFYEIGNAPGLSL